MRKSVANYNFKAYRLDHEYAVLRVYDMERAYLVLKQCVCEGCTLVSTSIAQQLLHSVTLGKTEWCVAAVVGRIHICFGRE